MMKNVNAPVDKDSMLYWYPLIKRLPIPQPRTICVKVKENAAFDVLEGRKMYPLKPFQEALILLGLPVFIRTDQMSGKHDWKDTCFLNSAKEKDLIHHIRSLVNETLSCDVMGRPVKAFFFRRFLYLDSKYKAFNEMPVSPERRYFIESGKVLCHHPYWIESAIRNPSEKDWKKLSREMNTETDEEIKILTRYAEMVSAVVDGFWSVDFCRTLGGTWFLIDMAQGIHSWHPEDCPHNRTEEIDYLKKFMEKIKP